MIIPGIIPSVITHAIAVYAFASVIVSASDNPNAVAVDVAAGSSYVIAPTTLNRIQGRGMPRNFESVKIPSKIEIAGAIVKTAVDKIVFLSRALSIPISAPCLYARTKKNTDCATTKAMITAARINRKLLFGLTSLYLG